MCHDIAEAHVFIVYAKVEGRLTSFVIERGAPGFTNSAKIPKMGMRASTMCELMFDDCRVPAENVLGTEGGGITNMMRNLEIERLGLGRLERLDLKSFWGEQLPDLTPWFLQNIDLLSETLGIDITPLEREINVDTGAFNVLGSDANGRPIVIENRLEATDHNQLGQMIVHASGLDAAVVIWVAPRFHEEFRRGLDWLNDRTDTKVDFFGVEIGLVRIGRSLPAPVLDVVVQPGVVVPRATRPRARDVDADDPARRVESSLLRIEAAQHRQSRMLFAIALVLAVLVGAWLFS